MRVVCNANLDRVKLPVSILYPSVFPFLWLGARDLGTCLFGVPAMNLPVFCHSLAAFPWFH